MRPKDAVRRRRLGGGVPSASAGRGWKGGGGWVELTDAMEERGMRHTVHVLSWALSCGMVVTGILSLRPNVFNGANDGLGYGK